MQLDTSTQVVVKVADGSVQWLADSSGQAFATFSDSPATTQTALWDEQSGNGLETIRVLTTVGPGAPDTLTGSEGNPQPGDHPFLDVFIA